MVVPLLGVPLQRSVSTEVLTAAPCSWFQDSFQKVPRDPDTHGGDWLRQFSPVFPGSYRPSPRPSARSRANICRAEAGSGRETIPRDAPSPVPASSIEGVESDRETAPRTRGFDRRPARRADRLWHDQGHRSDAATNDGCAVICFPDGTDAGVCPDPFVCVSDTEPHACPAGCTCSTYCFPRTAEGSANCPTDDGLDCAAPDRTCPAGCDPVS